MSESTKGPPSKKPKPKSIEKRDRPGWLDEILKKIISRKLMVWLTATYLCLSHNVTSEDWVAIALAYIGSQAAVDLAKAWKKG